MSLLLSVDIIKPFLAFLTVLAQTKIKIKKVKVGNCKQLNLSAKIIVYLFARRESWNKMFFISVSLYSQKFRFWGIYKTFHSHN